VGSFTPRPFYLRCPLDRRLGWPENRSGRGGEEKKIPSILLPGIEPQSPSSYFTSRHCRSMPCNLCSCKRFIKYVTKSSSTLAYGVACCSGYTYVLGSLWMNRRACSYAGQHTKTRWRDSSRSGIAMSVCKRSKTIKEVLALSEASH
jgi:hypothetical protein